MTQTRLRMVANGAGLVVVLAGAWLVAQTTPSPEQWQGPFVVHGELGETVTGRNIEASVTEVRIAEEVVASNGWAGATTGVWVVVDASVATVVNDLGGLFDGATLVINDTVYSASLRPDTATLAGRPLSTGVPLAGSLMFELPRDLVHSIGAEDAVIRLSLNDDTRTDSLVEVAVDLTELPILPRVETDTNVWGAQ